MNIRTFVDCEEWCEACTAELRMASSAAISGGSTPLAWFDYLARAEFPAPAHLELYWVDERLVPVEDPESNIGNATRHWLEHVSGVDIHPLTEAGYPDDFRVDQVWLGMGPDCHTASWFPGRKDYAAAGMTTWVAPPVTVQPPLPRISLTLEAVLRAPRLEMMLRGRQRFELFLKAVKRTPDPAYPVSLLHPALERLNVWVLLDS